MKRATEITVLVLCSVLFCTPPASAQRFSLWSDTDRSACEVTLTGPYQIFHVVVFLEPGPEGAFGAEYKLAAPANHFSPGGNVIAPIVSESIIGYWYGSPGISMGFNNCQTELVWIIDMRMMAMDTTPAYYSIEPHETTNRILVPSCT